MKIYLWDLPLRLFHWLLASCVVGAFVTAKIGGNLMVWHGRLGLVIVGLLAFRLVWGFFGSTYARFTVFVRGPTAVLAYLRGAWQGQGHNPLGALSVLALLGVLSLQALSGLFSNDDIAFNGYLVSLVGNDLSSQLTGFHRLLEKGLIVLVALHIGAILFYAHVKKHNLVTPMLTGWAEGSSPAQSTKGGRPTTLVLALLIAVAAAWAAAGGLLPPPLAAVDPAATTTTPAF